FADRQTQHCQQPGDDDEQRDDDGENWPVDEELGEFHWCASLPRAFASFLAVVGGSVVGVTGVPGRTPWHTLPMKRSLGLSPVRTTRKPSTIGPSVTGRYSATLPAPSAKTKRLSRSVPTARSSTISPR